ncbi:MAG: hypothetical protein AAGU14_11930 [Eubacteriaceae bacterium]
MSSIVCPICFPLHSQWEKSYTMSLISAAKSSPVSPNTTCLAVPNSVALKSV